MREEPGKAGGMKYSLSRGLSPTVSCFRWSVRARKIVGSCLAMPENRLHILRHVMLSYYLL